jgi:hypothetical protein
MKKIYSVAICIPFLFLQICNSAERIEKNRIRIILKTIDHFGNPVQSKDLIYQQLDCEYDFNNTLHTSTNKKGYGKLYLEPGYLQIYDSKFLHESYFCTTITTETDTLTIYAATVPTFIVVKDLCGEVMPGVTVRYFENRSGDCYFESVATGSTILTDAAGRATLYLPFQATYKIQVEGYNFTLIDCFQPDQKPSTLEFTTDC